jgi:DNA-binding NarL/FixJ family response regulator
MEATKQLQFVLASADPGDESGLRLLLEGTPWEPLPTLTGEDAVKALHEIALPIVLLNRDLDGRPWPETVRLLVKARRRTRVILLGDSGHSDAKDLARSGAFDVLARPFEKDDLFATLICAYSQARMHWLSCTRVHASPVAATIS